MAARNNRRRAKRRGDFIQRLVSRSPWEVDVASLMPHRIVLMENNGTIPREDTQMTVSFRRNIWKAIPRGKKPVCVTRSEDELEKFLRAYALLHS